ncbi:hypothetical protein MNBD_GAMMA08-1888 [hydrothermal vent metagenome]|uniref:NADH:ubiquinone oxidoreductase subunit 5 (Chain L)/Multisubunit Na+/H+ antiporter, MnhA subunit n=1 Tax=hydrothermal vent metagenome TaxID=652676 RepID=A0A3B0XSD9_9ZZZZ
MKDITEKIIGCAIEVHKNLGPGLLESTYEACLHHELLENNILVLKQAILPVTYKGINIDAGYRIDLLVNNTVIVELKSVKTIMPIHEAQIMTYLRLSKKTTGLILNFNVSRMKDGIKRYINNKK